MQHLKKTHKTGYSQKQTLCLSLNTQMVLTLFDVLPILSLLGKHDSSPKCMPLFFNITCFKQGRAITEPPDALRLHVNSGVFLHVITFNLSYFVASCQFQASSIHLFWIFRLQITHDPFDQNSLNQL